jgi:hypothetical protein
MIFDSYEGGYLNGLRHGFGENHYHDDGFYKGYFKNDLREGKGVL